MRNLFKTGILSVLATSMAASPALADKYVYYGNGWGRGHHHGRVQYITPPPYIVRNVYVQQPQPYYYAPRTYYNQPVPAPATYSSVVCTNRYNPLALLLGGAAGGIVGHQIGKGRGNIAATIGGAVLGSAIGAGAVREDCTEQVFRQVPVGTPVYWQTADASENYSFTATRDYRTQGRYCREYQTVSTVAGRQQQTYGTACMQPDGSWEVMN